MSNSEKSAFIGGVGVFIVLVSVKMMAFAFCQQSAAWQQEAIDHGAARYNATSGEFEWIDKTEVTE